ncbi:putative amine oxidase [Apodospora peruviana]|uniref:Amine oxidase n=1 Tax=Apodospora peruviana TaxID=516989 RepID=A0AAE0M1P7_9PEZI|nr:putative amine oxidase [Apodospora peruviana]
MQIPATPIDVDVVIVGAGLSGLRATVEIHKAGFSCAVLEATNHVGGKTLSVRGSPGVGCGAEGWVDLGAAWINDTTQREMYGLARQFGFELIEQRCVGSRLRQTKDGTVLAHLLGSRKETEDPEVLRLYAMVDRLTKTWLGPDKLPLDMVTFKALVEANCHGQEAMAAANLLTGAFLGVEADEVSALCVIEHVKSCTGLENMASETLNGVQHLRVRQGAQAFASRLADLITQNSLHLSSPVTKITRSADTCVTETATGGMFNSKKVIVSIPTIMYHTITFSPPLPGAKQILGESTINGYQTKVALVFSTPWWREAGLSGAMESTKGPIAFTRENCSEQDKLYSIECFIVGEEGRKWSKPAAEERQTKVWEHFVEVFGGEVGSPAIPRPVRIIEKGWTTVPVMPPGGITSASGQALCAPVGNIHFVGAETADVWRGHMEGAVRSGIRGAREVIPLLRATQRRPWAQYLRSLL